jgi:hypothetical protein
MLRAGLVAAALCGGLALVAPGAAAADTPPPSAPLADGGAVASTGGLSTFGTGVGDDVSARKNDGGTADKPKSKKDLCSDLVGTLNSDLQGLAWADKSGDLQAIQAWREQVAMDFKAGAQMGCGWAA